MFLLTFAALDDFLVELEGALEEVDDDDDEEPPEWNFSVFIAAVAGKWIWSGSITDPGSHLPILSTFFGAAVVVTEAEVVQLKSAVCDCTKMLLFACER